MGNCCTSEDRQDDPNFSMKRNNLQSAGEAGNHAPAPEYAEKVDQMNPLNPKVKETAGKLSEFNGKAGKSFDDLPELGPYRYNNGATYQGQFNSGLRTGFGRQVRINFSS